MRVFHQKTGEVLVEHLSLADRPLSRLRGLLGRKEFLPGEGLLLVPCNWVHTLGMKFPIEVLFLDKSYQVVAIEKLKPGRFGKPHKSRFALELPEGTLTRVTVSLGDKLELEEELPFRAG